MTVADIAAIQGRLADQIQLQWLTALALLLFLLLLLLTGLLLALLDSVGQSGLLLRRVCSAFVLRVEGPFFMTFTGLLRRNDRRSLLTLYPSGIGRGITGRDRYLWIV